MIFCIFCINSPGLERVAANHCSTKDQRLLRRIICQSPWTQTNNIVSDVCGQRRKYFTINWVKYFRRWRQAGQRWCVDLWCLQQEVSAATTCYLHPTQINNLQQIQWSRRCTDGGYQGISWCWGWLIIIFILIVNDKQCYREELGHPVYPDLVRWMLMKMKLSRTKTN